MKSEILTQPEKNRSQLPKSEWGVQRLRSISTYRERLKARTPFSVVSMFSGCGGMDLGFQGGFTVFGKYYRRHPVEVLWANDLNQAACKTYRKNLGHEIRCGDIWDVIDSVPRRADLVIGGFPCQDISVNGKRVGVDGSRSGLYRAMVEVIHRVKPRAFVAENVKGLLTGNNGKWIEQVLKDFSGLGYNLNHKLYRVADYGVPQNRERVFIVGTAIGERLFISPRPERTSENWMTAREAIADLEGVQRSVDINHIWSLAEASPEQGTRILSSDRPAHTIRAECHGNIQFHYKLPRRISMREAARFQSFPDGFSFESGLRETERQIGNAVPPVMAWHIAKRVLACLTP